MRTMKMEMKMAWTLAAAVAATMLLGGCTTVQTTTRGANRSYVATAPQTNPLPPRLEGRVLQACVDHASAAERADRKSDFLFMSFDRDNLRAAPLHNKKLGREQVAAVLSGQGTWQGYNDHGNAEYRAITFNCFIGKGGPIYTLVQAQ
ncbi:MAG TPA: hypothetical protein VHP58_07030 [Alphaproteobacteria bacterium]|nr:hypothetical protein [Alphaproteobacteria bacterium]